MPYKDPATRKAYSAAYQRSYRLRKPKPKRAKPELPPWFPDWSRLAVPLNESLVKLDARQRERFFAMLVIEMARLRECYQAGLIDRH